MSECGRYCDGCAFRAGVECGADHSCRTCTFWLSDICKCGYWHGIGVVWPWPRVYHLERLAEDGWNCAVWRVSEKVLIEAETKKFKELEQPSLKEQQKLIAKWTKELMDLSKQMGKWLEGKDEG